MRLLSLQADALVAPPPSPGRCALPCRAGVQHGHSAVEFAAREGRPGALEVLLRHGGRANAQDKVCARGRRACS